MVIIKAATIGYANSAADQADLVALGCDIIVRTDMLIYDGGLTLQPPIFTAFTSAPSAFPASSVMPIGSFDPGTSDFMADGMAIAGALPANQCVCGNRDLSGNGWEVMLAATSLYFQGSGAFAQTSAGIIDIGVPFHWRVTRKDGEVQIHINGTLRAKANVSTPSGSSQAMSIGRRASGTFPFTGSMFKFRYWNCAAEYSGSTIGVNYFSPPTWPAS